MIDEKTRQDVLEKTLKIFDAAKIVLTDKEKENIEFVDEGLNDIYDLGLEIVVYINTERVCAKEICMLPFQTCPEHMHPPIDGKEGKEETFRVRWGKMYLYVPGERSEVIHAKVPSKYKFKYFHEIEMNPGDQYTITPGTWHWFQAGEEGCIVSEFSTKSVDEKDVFTDETMVRVGK